MSSTGAAVIKPATVNRAPRSGAAITAGALRLPLAEKVQLVKELKSAISNEVNQKKVAAELAQDLFSQINDDI